MAGRAGECRLFLFARNGAGGAGATCQETAAGATGSIQRS